MTGNLRHKPTTRRDAADAVRLKAEGDPSHINAHEARLLQTLMPEAAGPVVTKGLLADAGRRGDDRVTKLTPEEAALLKARGGSGTVNPASGLLEYNAGDGNGASDDGNGGVSGSTGSDSVGNSGGKGDSKGGDTVGAGDSGGTDPFGLEQQAYDPTRDPSIESLLNTPNGYRAPGYEGLSMMQYSPPDTFGRLFDTYRYGPPPSYTARGQVPGNLGMPTGLGPGMAGKAAASFGGPAMSAAMNLGMHMDQAMSPESRAASLSANQAQGAKNSTGLDNSGRASMAAGSASGASTAAPLAESLRSNATQTAVPPGYTLNPAGQIVPLPIQGNNRPAYQDPLRNLLLDYVLRGRQGGGLLG